MNMRNAKVYMAFIAVVICALFGWILTHQSMRSTAHNQQSASTTMEIPDPDFSSPHYSYDGLSLASAPLAINTDTALLTNMLNVQLLKFSAKTTKPNLIVTYILELREKGQPTKVISNFVLGPFGGSIKPSFSNFYVGFLPLNGNLEDADKIKYQIMTSGLSELQVIDNPFKGCRYCGSATSDSSQKDIPLLSAHMSYGAGSVERTLFLRLETKPGK